MAEVEPPRVEEYSPEGRPIDLAAGTLEQLTLRGEKGDRALVLLKDNFYYYEDVVPGGTLHLALAPEDGGDQACCWGASQPPIAFSELLRQQERSDDSGF